MLYKIIKKYASTLTKNDIINYSINNNHYLKEYEVDIIFSEIHNNIDSLLNDTDNELKKIKDKLEHTTYLKIIKLINFYKEKYKNYL